MKPTKEWLKATIKDEELAIEDYKKRGLVSLARDEAKHKFFLEQRLKKMK